MIRFALAFAALVSIFSPAHAADWFKLGDSEFASRLKVTIENPGDADKPAVLVTMPLDKLGEAMPAATASTIAVADQTHTIVPFQISKIDKESLVFVVPVPAHGSNTVYVYASKEPLNVPKFAAMTGADVREAYRSFENEFMAFRMEVGEKAKTTGLAVDMFGKTKAGHGAQLKTIYASEYHQRQPWGIDILKVGSGPGLGGAYVVMGDTLGRTSAPTTDFKVLFEGPIATRVQASGPVEVNGKKFTITRTLTCLAGDRALDDVVEVKGDDAKEIKIGLGLRDLPNNSWIEKADAGYCFVHGDGNQAGTEKLGLGIAFDPATYDSTRQIEDKSNGGRIYIFTPEPTAHGGVRLSDRLLAYWDGDGWINNPDDFEKALAQYGLGTRYAAKIGIAEQPEMR
jgi:hypothetical protein